MAEDTLEIQKDELPFHPCTTPRGMSWYDLNVLTPLQQKLLNEVKIDTVKENNEYLGKHPEIRAITALLLRAVLKERPKLKTVADCARDFFSRSKAEIQSEIDQYLIDRGEPLNKEGDSAIHVPGDLVINPSLDDFGTFYKQDYLTYTSYTTEEEMICESIGEWSTSKEYEAMSSESPVSITGYSDTDAEFQRKQFEVLFSSKASIYSPEEEGYEEATVEIAKDYMRYEYYTEEEKESEAYSYESDHMIHEEMALAEEIRSKLSIILENLDEEQYEDEQYEDKNDEEQLDEKSSTDFDPFNEKSLSDETPEQFELKEPTQISETMLEYEQSIGG